MARETIEEIKARIAQVAADEQAEVDAKLAVFDQGAAARKSKAEAERTAQEKARQEALHADATARFEREHMEPAKRAWLAAGGTLEEFERAKPQIRQEKLAQISLDGSKTKREWQRSAVRRYR